MACWCNGQCPYITPAKKLAEEGKGFKAHAELRNILVQAPFCVEANIAIATVLVRGNHADQAGVHLERAAKSGGETPRIKFERATLLRAQSLLPEAITEFYEAMKLEPDNAGTAAGLMGALEMADRLKDAKLVAAQAVTTFPGNEFIRRQAAVIAMADKDYAGAVEILSVDNITPIEYLDRGRAREKLGDHAAAWDDWMTGRRIFREKFNHRYNAERFQKIFAGLAHAGTAPRPSFLTPAPPLELAPSPLFVTGFPRSGTTMMETVLSNHPQVQAGDELMAITDVIDAMAPALKMRMRYPAAMMAASLGENSHWPALFRDLYYRSAQGRVGFLPKKRNPKKPFFFTDKMPLNEMHIPLIRLLFPAAPMIYMRRHPLDVMVSCMSHWLPHGGFYASSLETCASHYLEVDRLVQHYKKNMESAFAVPRFLEVGYENFIAEPGEHATAICTMLGIPPYANLLAVEKNKRTARTLSYRQVREPLNPASIGRWRHYRDQLAPAVEILRPILDREGYES